MAELHRRILRFPNRRGRLAGLSLRAVVGILLFSALVCAESRAVAHHHEDTAGSAPRAVEIDTLHRIRDGIASRVASERDAALLEARSLPEQALEAISARIDEMRRERVPTEDGYQTLREFAHEVGSSRADDPVDIFPGIAPVLTSGMTRVRARMAERVALLRALEAMGSVEAAEVARELFRLDFETFRWEARHSVRRLGRAALPFLLISAFDAHGAERQWARWALDVMDLENPGKAVQRQSSATLIRLFPAYAQIKHMGAMNVVVSFIDDERPEVRAAARGAMQDYGHNAIWRFREAFETLLGEEADPNWSWRRTMNELYEGLDAQRLAPYHERLDGALERFEAGEVEAARESIDQVLREMPRLPRAKRAAVVYAAEGLGAMEREDWQAARAALERALLLDPSHPRSTRWRAALSLSEGELSLLRGAPNPAAFRRALESEVGAERARERLEGQRPEAPIARAAGAEGGSSAGTKSLEVLRSIGARVPITLGLALLFWPGLLWAGKRAAPRARASGRRVSGRAGRLMGLAIEAGLARLGSLGSNERPPIGPSPPSTTDREGAERGGASKTTLPPELLFGAPQAKAAPVRARTAHTDEQSDGSRHPAAKGTALPPELLFGAPQAKAGPVRAHTRHTDEQSDRPRHQAAKATALSPELLFGAAKPRAARGEQRKAQEPVLPPEVLFGTALPALSARRSIDSGTSEALASGDVEGVEPWAEETTVSPGSMTTSPGVLEAGCAADTLPG